MLALSSEQEMLVSSLEDLPRGEVAEDAFKWDGDPPWPNVELLANLGYLGINVDEAYGGGTMSDFEAMLTIETVGRVCPDTAEFLYNQQMVAPRAIEMFGTEAAKERYLPPVTAGDDDVAIAISEPEAGSDVGAKLFQEPYQGAGAVQELAPPDRPGSLHEACDQGLPVREHYRCPGTAWRVVGHVGG